MAKIRIMLADDHTLFRQGIRTLISVEPDMEVIGEAANGGDAVDRANELRPDVVLMDIGMPGMSGLEALKIIKQEYPAIKVIIQTVFEDDEKIFEAVMNGASGYLIKKTTPSRLLEAIEEVYNGGATMTPGIAQKALAMFRNNVTMKPGNQLPQLNERQKEILELIVEGHNFRAIGEKLFITKATVRYHVKNIYDLVEVNSKAALVAKAFRKK